MKCAALSDNGAVVGRATHRGSSVFSERQSLSGNACLYFKFTAASWLARQLTKSETGTRLKAPGV